MLFNLLEKKLYVFLLFTDWFLFLSDGSFILTFDNQALQK